MPSASSARPRPNGSPTSPLRDRLLEQGNSLVDGPCSAATRPLDRVTCASTQSRLPYRVCLPKHRALGTASLSGRARAAPRRSRRSTSGCSGRPPEPCGLPLCFVEPPAPTDVSPLQSATSPRIARCQGRWSANCCSASSRARSECLRARSRSPRMDGNERNGKVVVLRGTSSPYWIEMSWARPAFAAASAQFLSQNSTQESAPERTRRRAARHARTTRGARARARRGPRPPER